MALVAMTCPDCDPAAAYRRHQARLATLAQERDAAEARVAALLQACVNRVAADLGDDPEAYLDQVEYNATQRARAQPATDVSCSRCGTEPILLCPRCREAV